MKVSPAGPQANFTAVVHSLDTVRFVASARNAYELCTKILTYIDERCDDVLWPESARQVHALIEERRPFAAIALYFAEVGERWDEEWLELGGMSLSELAGPPESFAEAG
jgi:hypothetical protein